MTSVALFPLLVVSNVMAVDVALAEDGTTTGGDASGGDVVGVFAGGTALVGDNVGKDEDVCEDVGVMDAAAEGSVSEVVCSNRQQAGNDVQLYKTR